MTRDRDVGSLFVDWERGQSGSRERVMARERVYFMVSGPARKARSERST